MKRFLSWDLLVSGKNPFLKSIDNFPKPDNSSWKSSRHQVIENERLLLHLSLMQSFFSHHFRPWGCQQCSLLLWNKLTASGIPAGCVTKPFQDLLGGKSDYLWAHTWCPLLLACSSVLVISSFRTLLWCLWFYFLVSIKVDWKNGWRKMLFIDITLAYHLLLCGEEEKVNLTHMREDSPAVNSTRSEMEKNSNNLEYK